MGLCFCLRTIFFIALFSQYLTKIEIPVPGYSRGTGFHVGWYPLFRLFPVSTIALSTFRKVISYTSTIFMLCVSQVILAIAASWIICAIITAAGGFPSDPSIPQYMARTDARTAVLKEAKWFRFPYPGL